MFGMAVFRKCGNMRFRQWEILMTGFSAWKGGDRNLENQGSLENLKEYMKIRGWSYRKLSGCTGISVDAINNKLNGRTYFTSYEIGLVCKALRIPKEDIAKYFIPIIESVLEWD